MGFRDLDNFNKALLAKYMWRVSNQPTSLVAQALKDKYFKDGNMMDVKLGPNPSFIRRSYELDMNLVKQ